LGVGYVNNEKDLEVLSKGRSDVDVGVPSIGEFLAVLVR
jgi:hypothetical protein